MPRPVDEQTTKERRGQFFTTSADVQEAMASLLTHAPSSSHCLEPSAGAGDLVSTLERHGYADIDAIEFDPSIETICRTEIERGSFFRYARGKDGRYDIIFGNPDDGEADGGYVATLGLPTIEPEGALYSDAVLVQTDIVRGDGEEGAREALSLLLEALPEMFPGIKIVG